MKLIILAFVIFLALPAIALAQGPITVITSTIEADTGLIFTAPNNRPLIADNEGRTVFSQTITVFDFKRQGDVLTYINLASERFEVLNRDYQVIDTWQAVGYQTDFHDLQLLDNGNALLLIYKSQTVDLSAYGGSVTATVQSCLIQELDASKAVVFEWDSIDYLPITQTNRSLTTQTVDYSHCNAVEQDSDGNILLSHRHLDEITKIDRQTGAVIWRLGGQGNEFTFVNDPGFSLQHDIRRIDNGHLTLFDNGAGARGYSRAVEYEIDEVGKVITKTWEFRGPFAFCCGNVQRLPSGHTFINFGPGHPTIWEVKPDGTPVFVADVSFSYRSFRFPWWRRIYFPRLLSEVNCQQGQGICAE